MDSNVSYIVFEYDELDHPEISLSNAISDEHKKLIREMIWGGFFDENTLHVNRFLREDKSINLEKLELAVLLAVEYLNDVTEFDDPIILYVDGFDKYYEQRGIENMAKNQREEYRVITGIITVVANQESPKPVTVLNKTWTKYTNI